MDRNAIRRFLASAGALLVLSTTNGCGTQKKDQKAQVYTQEQHINNLCSKEHFDKGLLNIKTLDNGEKYISDQDIKLSIRENFTNKNSILNCERTNDKRVQEIFDRVKYLYLYDNEKIRTYIEQFIISEEAKYNRTLTTEELIYLMNLSTDFNRISCYLYFEHENSERIFKIGSDLTDYDSVEETIKNDTVYFYKDLEIIVTDNNTYKISEEYCLSSPNKSNDDITVELSCDYYTSNKSIVNNYACEKFENELYIKRGPKRIKTSVDEVTANKIAKSMVDSVNNKISVEQFLDENNELLSDLFEENYNAFVKNGAIESKKLTYKNRNFS